MTSKSTSQHQTIQKECHDVKNVLWCQKVCHDVESLHDEKSSPWCQKYVMTSKTCHNPQNMCHGVKTRSDVRMFVMTSKNRHDVKDTPWHQYIPDTFWNEPDTNNGLLNQSILKRDIQVTPKYMLSRHRLNSFGETTLWKHSVRRAQLDNLPGAICSNIHTILIQYQLTNSAAAVFIFFCEPNQSYLICQPCISCSPMSSIYEKCGWHHRIWWRAEKF